MQPEKDNAKNIVNQGDLSNFSGGSFFAYVLKKTERLNGAIYLLTDFFPQEEPLKWRLRDKNLLLLDILSDYSRNGVDVDRKAITGRFSSVVAEIISMLAVGKLSNNISEMNHNILKDEYLSVLEGIRDERIGSFLGRVSLTESFFSIEKDSLLNQKNLPDGGFYTNNDKGFYKGHYKGQNDIKDKDNMSFTNKTDKAKKVFSSIGSKAEIADKKIKSSRQEEIMLIVRAKKEISVKDISDVISDCSEKTLQRELVSMTKKGLLKKTGERRWSRYSLARGR